MSKKRFKQKKPSKDKEWPAVVYLWSLGSAGFGYFIGETVFRFTEPHPIHWLLALMGWVFGFGAGWLWYLWRGDVI